MKTKYPISTHPTNWGCPEFPHKHLTRPFRMYARCFINNNNIPKGNLILKIKFKRYAGGRRGATIEITTARLTQYGYHFWVGGGAFILIKAL